METILVQMSEKSWTMQALHLACALARNYSTTVTLLRLMSVGHPSYLGTDFGKILPTYYELDDLSEYAATAEDYGVELTIRSMQCVTTLDALVDAADQVNAGMVFAHIHKSWIPYWSAFQTWNLKRRLSAARHLLFTLDNTLQNTEYVPSITVESTAQKVPSK